MTNTVINLSIGHWDRQAQANCVDPDQMPQNAASDQGLHCLPLIQYFMPHQQIVNGLGYKFRKDMLRDQRVSLFRIKTVN